jgi:hypothetical protein
LGGGLGVANPTHAGVRPGPAVDLYAAYGLTDMFDVKLDLVASDHAVDGLDDRYRTFLGTLGLAYKIDVIEWIPYLGLSAGLWRTDLPETVSEKQQDIALGGFAGLDYAVSLLRPRGGHPGSLSGGGRGQLGLLFASRVPLGLVSSAAKKWEDPRLWPVACVLAFFAL